MGINVWPDGNDGPYFKITRYVIGGYETDEFVMPATIDGLEKDFHDRSPIKRAKYTGKIYKGGHNRGFDVEFHWILWDKKMPGHLIANAIDFLNLIELADNTYELYPRTEMWVRLHADDHPDFYYEFRLNGGLKIKSLKGKNVAYDVRMKITSDGKVIDNPLNTKRLPLFR
jgi:hypothetical protein